jgi:hypothetical protein
MTPEEIEYAKGKARNIAAALLAWVEGKKIASVRHDEETSATHYQYRDGVPVLYFEHHEDYAPETWHEVQEPQTLTLWSIQSPDVEKAWISTSDSNRAAKWKAAGHVVIQSKQEL